MMLSQAHVLFLVFKGSFRARVTASLLAYRNYGSILISHSPEHTRDDSDELSITAKSLDHNLGSLVYWMVRTTPTGSDALVNAYSLGVSVPESFFGADIPRPDTGTAAC